MGIITFWFVGCIVMVGGASMPLVEASDYKRHVQEQCGFTRYPNLCVETLTSSGSGSQNRHGADILSALVNETILETRRYTSYSAQVSSMLGSHEARHAKAVTDYCEELMILSLRRLERSLEALKERNKNKRDVQTWLSAALTLQAACKDSVETHSHSLPLSNSNNHLTFVSQKMDRLSQLGSNSLALVNRITRERPTKTKKNRNIDRKDDFPSWVFKRDRKLLQDTVVQANAVVAKDGTGDYTTISEAINAASGNRFVIYIKAGVYKEKIHANKNGLTLIGDGKYSTIITGDDSVAGGASLPGSATFTISGDRFIAREIGFQNSAGPQGDQAIALTVASDHTVLYRCSIAGYQDTLYALALRQFYRECDIYGTVDFIFGNAAAVFQNCFIAFRKPGNKAYNVIAANGRSDPGQNTGFSFQMCRITVSSEFSSAKHSVASYLGRPWKYYSRTVIMQSTIDDAIAARGWIEWPGYSSSVLSTLYFAEYANDGPGAGTSGRVKWPGFHVIGAKEASKFTVANFIYGNSWLPSTGVTFISGLN